MTKSNNELAYAGCVIAHLDVAEDEVDRAMDNDGTANMLTDEEIVILGKCYGYISQIKNRIIKELETYDVYGG